MPKNTPAAIIVAGFSFTLAFALIWRVWWIAALSAIAVVISIVIRSLNNDTEYKIPARTVEKMEAEALARRQAA